MQKRPLRAARSSVTAPLCCRLMKSQGANLLLREHHSSNLSFGWSVYTTYTLVPSGRSMVVFTVTPLGTTPRASLCNHQAGMETRGAGTRGGGHRLLRLRSFPLTDDGLGSLDHGKQGGAIVRNFELRRSTVKSRGGGAPTAQKGAQKVPKRVRKDSYHKPMPNGCA